MKETTFWRLITTPGIHKICIPSIQRDYAQGRRNKVYLRHNFLTALKKALVLDQTLTLDFVYGVDNETMFVPLDGQQRLTTLWLLHWFVAFKAGILQSQSEVAETLSKFSYETRISSTDFCRSLCRLSTKPKELSLREWVMRQTWFFHQYKQDPTIMGMLNTICGTDITDSDKNDISDGLEEIFTDDLDFVALWNLLTTTSCIRFNKLEVGLDDSDDLYIKMNARGKQLTDFENFKTELVKHAQQDDILGEKDALVFAAKLDVEWTDIFWENHWKNPETNDISIDEIYFTFIRRYARLMSIKRFGDKNDYLKQITSNFNTFEPYKQIFDSKQTIEDFITIMDHLRNNKLNTLSCWGDSFDFVPKYNGSNKKKDVTPITNTQQLLFYGYCQYLRVGQYAPSSFSEWNRVLWNICENRTDKSNQKPTINVIDLLVPYSHDILRYLSQEAVIDVPDNKVQLLEEQCKARRINEFPKIREMEGYAFFKGAIRFLYTTTDNTEDWSSFQTKVNNVRMLIPYSVEERHTIKALTPYLNIDGLEKVYSSNWVSNNNEDLRSILLDRKAVPFVHEFLLQSSSIYDTPLHRDILALCEKAFGGKGYLRIDWNESKYIWTQYEKRSGYYQWDSLVIGDEDYARITKIIEHSEYFSIYSEQKKRQVCSYYKGLYLLFQYQDFYFSLYGNNTICLMTQNWNEKMSNPQDKNGFYCLISEIKDEESLLSALWNLIEQYNKNRSSLPTITAMI